MRGDLIEAIRRMISRRSGTNAIDLRDTLGISSSAANLYLKRELDAGRLVRSKLHVPNGAAQCFATQAACDDWNKRIVKHIEAHKEAQRVVRAEQKRVARLKAAKATAEWSNRMADKLRKVDPANDCAVNVSEPRGRALSGVVDYSRAKITRDTTPYPVARWAMQPDEAPTFAKLPLGATLMGMTA